VQEKKEAAQLKLKEMAERLRSGAKRGDPFALYEKERIEYIHNHQDIQLVDPQDSLEEEKKKDLKEIEADRYFRLKESPVKHFFLDYKALLQECEDSINSVEDLTEKEALRCSEDYSNIIKNILDEYNAKSKVAFDLLEQFSLFNLSPFITQLPFYEQMIVMDYFLDQLYQATHYYRKDDDPLRKYIERYPLTASASQHAVKIINAYTSELKNGYSILERLTGFGLIIGGSALMVLSVGVGYVFFKNFFTDLFKVGYSLLSNGHAPHSYKRPEEKTYFYRFFPEKQQRAQVKAASLEITEKIKQTQKEDKTFVKKYEKNNPSAILNREITMDFPKNVVNIIVDYAAGESHETLRFGAVPFVHTLFNSIKIERVACLKNLLTAIVFGRIEKVENILKESPFLVLEELDEKEWVTAPSGQNSNNKTAYRTALAVEDAEIAAIIKSKLIELADEEEADKQFNAQFPKESKEAKGWEEIEKDNWAAIFAQLTTLTDAIKNAKTNTFFEDKDADIILTYRSKLTVREGSEVGLAFAQFKVLLKAKQDEIVTIGRHFNSKLLLEASQILKFYYYKYSNFVPQTLLLWQQVIGTIQRMMPANYAQVFCRGIYQTLEDIERGGSQSRHLGINDVWRRDSSAPYAYFYSLKNQNPRLGFDYAIDQDGHGDRVYPNDTVDFAISVSKIISIKSKSIQKLLNPKAVEMRSPVWC